MTWAIRTLNPADAPAVAELGERFADHLISLSGTSDHHLTAEAILRDGFGPHPAFAGLVAEWEGAVVGYLLYHFGYDADNAARNLHIIDLYVDARIRKRGIGTALMSSAAKICRESGGAELFWAVFVSNQREASFV